MSFRSFKNLIFIVAIIFTNPAFAASPEDVEKVVKMVTDKSTPALLRKTYFLPSGEVRGHEAVFVCDGNRYTIYNSSALLTFWVRKDGTSGEKTLDTFSDSGLDGTADNDVPQEQERLDDAITALLRCRDRD